MTHSDIYKKFMIEYDKDDITSSYPPLTEYEVATILDKAYLALLAQKLTGNNPRQVAFEGDNKAIEDVRPLLSTTRITPSKTQSFTNSDNEMEFDIPDDMLYYIQSSIYGQDVKSSIDNKPHFKTPAILVTHDNAQNFKSSSVNLPWIQNPVAYIESKTIHILYDIINNNPTELFLTYIKKPNKFALENDLCDFTDTQFELSDTVAEELISLAIVLATKIVESPRFTTEVQSRPLES